MKHIFAIDPGKSGAIVWTADGQLKTAKMPDTDGGIVAMVEAVLFDAGAGAVCYWERVGSYRPGNSGPSAAKFADHCGLVRGILLASHVPQHRIAPVIWQRAVFGALPKDKAQRKRAIKAKMEELYPYIDVTLWNADALGIYTYALERERGGNK